MSKSFDEIIETIESLLFDANMNAISGFSVFIHVLQTDPIIQQLIALLHENHKQCAVVYDHLLKQLYTEYDKNYEHPKDASIATYFYVLTCCDIQLASNAKAEILKHKNLFWTAYLVHNLSLDSLSDSVDTKKAGNF